jgi:hypothetical protein
LSLLSLAIACREEVCAQYAVEAATLAFGMHATGGAFSAAARQQRAYVAAWRARREAGKRRANAVTPCFCLLLSSGTVALVAESSSAANTKENRYNTQKDSRILRKQGLKISTRALTKSTSKRHNGNFGKRKYGIRKCDNFTLDFD